MPLLILAIVILSLSLMASRHAARRFQQAMARAQRSHAPYAHTGAEIARIFLKSEGITDVDILPHQALVTDYFDPRRHRLFLSRRVHDATSLAAWAVALHEAAHALQARDTPGDLKWRQSCIRLTRYGPTLIALVLAALTVLKVVPSRIALILFGVLWAVIFLLNVGSLAIEWNANLRLRRFLDDHLANHPDARDQLDRLLPTVATRELGDLADSPRYFFLSALPGTSKLRPVEKPAADPGDKPDKKA
jgi:Zn-dependent membrane protease YugP